ncbi:MAG: hypothetical protein KA371_12300 [Acidobacteria bacterium]|nr:hypothetical protein [Acidobacteriota bacterium]
MTQPTTATLGQPLIAPAGLIPSALTAWAAGTIILVLTFMLGPAGWLPYQGVRRLGACARRAAPVC